ncbi:MAG: hypothetical protein AUJ28_03230 [Parcubacteria group bacterium CG1_02_37_51]|uniref:Band 7 domain-containing protein n=2 Tax=Candidatus Komeiliibacteriota TaxID=1817908 RepID=A0A2M8DRV4_9BACT|nr:MAG: hypothetical protein AUJ28_03230 [Parcubacteria group bacterium CG1_02_37_51]PIY95416.1 MAG: hypothetical protein COY67_00065 [Candidatus Komeilibacteria bacterium CG_4_10_14_0_8_um_filter_37_78]PJC02103.1 MAG: hypothetical protein CO073_01235 [Candidatus Komeilibacteria bacterium CG_4_9_14_0_8_um_filter_36_9]
MDFFIYFVGTVLMLAAVIAVILAMAFTNTPADVSRLVIRMGRPRGTVNDPDKGITVDEIINDPAFVIPKEWKTTNTGPKQLSGMGFIFPFFETYQDIPKMLFDFDYTEIKVDTDSKWKVEQSRKGSGNKKVKIKTDEAYVDVDCAVELTLPETIPDMIRFWMRAEYFPGNFKKTKEALEKVLKNFVLATQRNIAGDHTYKDLLYNREVIEKKVNTIFRTENAISDSSQSDDSSIRNEFKFLGISQFRYVISKVTLSKDLQKVIDALAVAQNEGEAVLEKAKFASLAEVEESKGKAKGKLLIAKAEAKGDYAKLKAIEDHLEAAAVGALNNTSNIIMTDKGAKNMPPIIIQGGRS